MRYEPHNTLSRHSLKQDSVHLADQCNGVHLQGSEASNILNKMHNGYLLNTCMLRALMVALRLPISLVFFFSKMCYLHMQIGAHALIIYCTKQNPKWIPTSCGHVSLQSIISSHVRWHVQRAMKCTEVTWLQG